MAKRPIASAKLMPEIERLALYQKLERWHKIATEAAKLRDEEMELRKEIVAQYFENAEEGTNTIVLEYGKVLKANLTITRKVDDAQLEALKTTARESGMTSILATIDVLFNYKPSLRTGEWKELDDANRKLFADVITEQPGAPSLAIETPKSALK